MTSYRSSIHPNTTEVINAPTFAKSDPRKKISLSFDRGTILLRSSERQLQLEKIDRVLWDDRVNAYRAPAAQYLTIQRLLRTQDFEFEDSVRHRWGDALNLAIPTLRPYQTAALNAWRNAKGRGLVVLPTGAGKTLIGIAAIGLTRRPSICLVPTRILLEQWRERLFEQFRTTIGILGDGKRIISPIMVATFESAYRYMNWIGDRFQLLVVDEAHHFGSGVRDEALEMCIAPFRLALTATPLANGEPQKRLTELVGPQVYEVTVSELTGKFLAPFDHETVSVELYDDERKYYEKETALFRSEFEKFTRAYPGSRWVDFAIWAKQTREGRRALLAFRRIRQSLGAARAKEESLQQILTRHRGTKTLIFTPDTESAYRISRRFLIAAITGDIKKREREEIFERFKTGVLHSLVSCRVLNEGIDVPDAEVAIILGGNHGEREHIQRIGRTLRPMPGKIAKVYELVAKNTVEVRHWQKRTESLAPRIFA
jgi:superfamily II DNA or RNA helicase